MKILITGSSGHLGEALCRTLKNTDNEVVGVDLLPSKFTDFVGNITEPAFVKNCMKGVQAVIHTATLHKPHVATHSRQQFVDTNITGTLNLLEEAHAGGVQGFIFTSTTSVFGDALTPEASEPAAWITEEVVPKPKNIYGVTKTAAEDLCQLFHRNHRLPCLVLRTSRFFPEADDNREIRLHYEDANAKVNEFLYRRAEIEDVVSAHLLALQKAREIGFSKYIISATSPFSKEDLQKLNQNAPEVIKYLFPEYEAIYKQRNWRMFPKIGRVYVNDKARRDLGWYPKYDFQYILDCLKYGRKYKSDLAQIIGKKGYYQMQFEDGPYPVDIR
jgi:UDP-glucose 4-epimerase